MSKICFVAILEKKGAIYDKEIIFIITGFTSSDSIVYRLPDGRNRCDLYRIFSH